MMKRWICFLVIIMLITGCVPKEKPTPDYPPSVVIETPYTLTDEYKNINTIKLGNKHVISDAKITTDGTILMQETSDVKTELYLFDINTKKFDKILEDTGKIVYGAAYQDDEIVVFYDYIKGAISFATAQHYYIYHKKTKVMDILNIREYSYTENEVDVDNTVDRIGDKLYFEVYNRPRTHDEQGKELDKGYAVYEYDLHTKEFNYLLDGMEPRNYMGKLVYVIPNEAGNGTLIYFDTKEIIISNLLQFAISENKIVSSVYIEPEMLTYLYQDGENKLLFSRPGATGETFWDFNINHKYITWSQTGNNLYIYDLGKEAFVFVSGKVGTNYAMPSEKYIFWMENEYNDKNKFDIKSSISFIEL